MTLSKISFFIFYFFVSTLICVGQPTPTKYGKVEEKEIALTSYHGADAVILYDYGEYKFAGKTGQVYFYFTHHMRIKILTKAGLRYATQKIPYYDLCSSSYYPYKEMYNLRAQTLNVNAKGKVVETKVKSKYTIESKPDNNYNASVTLLFPNVKVGSIIEYEITIPTIETVNPDPWMVQYDIPCMWNELRIITPLEFNYAIQLYNIDYSDVYEFKNISTSISYPGQLIVYNADQFQFIRTDVPSLPYPGNDMDYNNSRMYVKFVLDYVCKTYLLPRMNEIIKAMEPRYKYLNKSEKQIVLENPAYIIYKRPDLTKIATMLNKSDEFGVPLILNMGFNDTIQKLKDLYNSNEEKVEAIYLFVRSLVDWDNQYRVFVDAPMPQFIVKMANRLTKEPVKMNIGLQKVVQKHEGSSSDINAILINLLKKAGFKTYPVLVSTLNNNYIDTSFFNIQQFNHLIAAVEVDGKEILLDAVKKGDGSIMSSDIMNEYGLLIDRKTARWIQVAYPYPILPRSLELPSVEQTE